MESGISFQGLIYNDAETRRWREFLEQDCDAPDVQVDITGAKDICGLIVHIFAVELRCVERLLGAAPMPYEQFPTADSMTFCIADTAPRKLRHLSCSSSPTKITGTEIPAAASRAEARRDASRLNLLSPWAYCGLR